EIMGLHLPGSAFINPGNELRDRITESTTNRAVEICAPAKDYTPLAKVVDEKELIDLALEQLGLRSHSQIQADCLK
ncbi:MAG: hypothetical protein F6K10_11955, partial [Moorea sp. SIO2B7]|nr:hypothetical protein [Moorena sp. SIO2B7]